jgi:hypothetical protein
MRKALLGFAALAIAAAGASAQTENSTIWSNLISGAPDSGWVVAFPSGSSDYFSAAYATSASLNVEGNTVSKAMPIKGVGVCETEFGSTVSYPTVGVFRPNVGLDATGNTPDLGSPIATSTEATVSGNPLFTYQDFDTTAQATIPIADATTLSVVQFPPGDSGLLGVGADSSAASNGTSGFTQDGFATASILISFLDFGMAIGQDNSATSSCKPADRAPHGRLRTQKLTGSGIMGGDHLTTTVIGGDTLNLAFFGSKSGDKWKLYFNTAPCSPAIAIGPVLPTSADSDGDGSFQRINATFPTGFGGQTFRFSAVWGNGGCISPGVGFTNCITVITGPDPKYGVVDDCTIESGWVVAIPAGSSDYFNNSYGPKPGSVNGVTALTISVLDFVTATPAYPSSGISTANTTVDPSGNSPNLTGPGVLATVSPYTFPAGSFETTCSQFSTHPVAVSGGAMTGPSINAWVQFPPGDSGLLGVGGDTTASNASSFFTQDGYTTASVAFFVNWGIRLKTN